jgi:catechol 2,3-dioxygenase-like lactoylglutathione lyase family enzyme
MEMKLELVLIPVSDVDRAKEFYLKQAAFDLLADTPIGDGKRIVQLTPPGSACSIGFGDGVTGAEPGSAQGLHLIVADIVAARAALVERGVTVSEVKHVGNSGWAPGPHPERASYQSFADFTDPDGNIWILQEVDHSKG